MRYLSLKKIPRLTKGFKAYTFTRDSRKLKPEHLTNGTNMKNHEYSPKSQMNIVHRKMKDTIIIIT